MKVLLTLIALSLVCCSGHGNKHPKPKPKPCKTTDQGLDPKQYYLPDGSCNYPFDRKLEDRGKAGSYFWRHTKPSYGRTDEGSAFAAIVPIPEEDRGDVTKACDSFLYPYAYINGTLTKWVTDPNSVAHYTPGYPQTTYVTDPNFYDGDLINTLEEPYSECIVITKEFPFAASNREGPYETYQAASLPVVSDPNVPDRLKTSELVNNGWVMSGVDGLAHGNGEMDAFLGPGTRPYSALGSNAWRVGFRFSPDQIYNSNGTRFTIVPGTDPPEWRTDPVVCKEDTVNFPHLVLRDGIGRCAEPREYYSDFQVFLNEPEIDKRGWPMFTNQVSSYHLCHQIYGNDLEEQYSLRDPEGKGRMWSPTQSIRKFPPTPFNPPFDVHDFAPTLFQTGQESQSLGGPVNVNETYGTGDQRSQQSAAIFSAALPWIRHHNWLANRWCTENGGCDVGCHANSTCDDEGYFWARKMNCGVNQRVFTTDWFEAGTLHKLRYRGFDKGVAPDTSQAVQFALLRTLHSQILDNFCIRRVNGDLDTTIDAGFGTPLGCLRIGARPAANIITIGNIMALAGGQDKTPVENMNRMLMSTAAGKINHIFEGRLDVGVAGLFLAQLDFRRVQETYTGNALEHLKELFGYRGRIYGRPGCPFYLGTKWGEHDSDPLECFLYVTCGLHTNPPFHPHDFDSCGEDNYNAGVLLRDVILTQEGVNETPKLIRLSLTMYLLFEYKSGKYGVFGKLGYELLEEYFNNIMTSDWWWWQNWRKNGLFTRDEYLEIKETNFATVLDRTMPDLTGRLDLSINAFKPNSYPFVPDSSTASSTAYEEI